ncbi:Neuroguidin-B -like protein [Trichinella pseudospiralis]|uniref:Neuroguidin-B-like protein n=2 Tax=Trichinella pseudospiralis TaxID=6337 RepID=A0A0V1FZJ9_TRIPS|nr:Neuroguidin-B -like protein [Trichinella pseudospiralis]
MLEMSDLLVDRKKLDEVYDNIIENTSLLQEFLHKYNDFVSEMAYREKGISLMEMKFHLLLSYVIQLNYILLKKLDGHTIEGDAVVDRLVEIRTVIERTRSIEEKMNYQIEKLLKSVSSKTVGDVDPLGFKAQPEAMDDQVESEDSDELETQDTCKKQTNEVEKYVPPKLMAVPYVEPKDKHAERIRRRVTHSSMIEDLKQQYSQGPEEIIDHVSCMRRQERNEQKRRIEYEEEYMVRLNDPKKKHRRRMDFQAGFSSLFDFAPDFAQPVTSKKGKMRKSGKKYKHKKTRRMICDVCDLVLIEGPDEKGDSTA